MRKTIKWSIFTLDRLSGSANFKLRALKSLLIVDFVYLSYSRLARWENNLETALNINNRVILGALKTGKSCKL